MDESDPQHPAAAGEEGFVAGPAVFVDNEGRGDDEEETNPINEDQEDTGPFHIESIMLQGGPVEVQEASVHVRSIWRSFLESPDSELRLDNVVLSSLDMQFLLDRISWLPPNRKPQKLVLSHAIFMTEHDHDNDQTVAAEGVVSEMNYHALPNSSSRAVTSSTTAACSDAPASALLMADCLAHNGEYLTDIELEDTLNNPRWNQSVVYALLRRIPRGINRLVRLKLRGLDLTTWDGFSSLVQHNHHQHPQDPHETTDITPTDSSNDPCALPAEDHQHTTNQFKPSKDLSILFKNILVHHKDNLLELDLESCRLNVETMAKGMAVQTNLQSLVIHECGVQEEGIAALVKHLPSSIPLEQVLLYDNQITSRAFESFAHLLRNHPGLQHLKLAFWGRHDRLEMRDESIQEFNKALRQHPQLTKLDIYCKHISAAQVVAWLRTFESSPSLEEIKFGVFHLKRKKSPTTLSTEGRDKSSKTRPFVPVTLEMKYGMLAGNEPEMETLFQGIAELEKTDCIVLHQTHVYEKRVGQALQNAMKSKQLANVHLHSCRFYQETFDMFAQGLQNVSKLESLVLAGCRLSNIMLTSLTESLALTLRKLDLSWNHLTVTAIQNLTLILTTSPSLKYLNLSRNEALLKTPLDDEEMERRIANTHIRTFVARLIWHPTLEHLDLSYCGLSMSLTVSLMQAWEANATRRALHMGFASVERNLQTNQVQMFGGVRAGQRTLLQPLLRAMGNMMHIQSLEFCGTDLRGPASGEALGKVLLSPKSNLRELSIYGIEHPPLSIESIEHLAHGMVDHRTLQVVRLGGCTLRDESFQTLVGGLVGLQNLRVLFLRYNSLSSQSLVSLAHIINQQEALHDLDLSSNANLFHYSHPQQYRPFLKAVRTHPGLRRLSLSHCGLNDAVINGLFYALETNKKLTELDLGGNQEVTVVEPWISTLADCRTLLSLKIPRTICSDYGWDLFLQRLHNNTSLRDLRYDHGQLPLVYTHYEKRFDGCLLNDPEVSTLLRRNKLLHLAWNKGIPKLLPSFDNDQTERKKEMGVEATSDSKNRGSSAASSTCSWAPLVLLLEKLGSNNGEGTPVYAMIHSQAAELSLLR